MTTRVTTPKEDVADASLDFTLSEEREGDNISGNKELRATEHEDETNSKRLKTPLHPPHQNERTANNTTLPTSTPDPKKERLPTSRQPHALK